MAMRIPTPSQARTANCAVPFVFLLGQAWQFPRKEKKPGLHSEHRVPSYPKLQPSPHVSFLQPALLKHFRQVVSVLFWLLLSNRAEPTGQVQQPFPVSLPPVQVLHSVPLPTKPSEHRHKLFGAKTVELTRSFEREAFSGSSSNDCTPLQVYRSLNSTISVVSNELLNFSWHLLASLGTP